MKIRHLFAVALLIIFSDCNYAGDYDNYAVLMNFGWGQKTVELGVYQEQQTTPEGMLTSGDSFSLFFHADTPYRYFGKSNFGYYYEMGYSPIDINQQRDDEMGIRDLGTQVKGEYFYLTPVLFYNWGSRSVIRNFSTKFGIGLGVGYLKADGDIVFTRNNQNTYHTIKLNDWGDSVSVLLDIRYNNWLFRTIANGPIVTRDKLDYDVFDFSSEIGYSFYFF